MDLKQKNPDQLNTKRSSLRGSLASTPAKKGGLAKAATSRSRDFRDPNVTDTFLESEITHVHEDQADDSDNFFAHLDSFTIGNISRAEGDLGGEEMDASAGNQSERPATPLVAEKDAHQLQMAAFAELQAESAEPGRSSVTSGAMKEETTEEKK